MKVVVTWSDGQEFHHEPAEPAPGDTFADVLEQEAIQLRIEMDWASAVPVSFELLA
jgi:hypothetical protein